MTIDSSTHSPGSKLPLLLRYAWGKFSNTIGAGLTRQNGWEKKQLIVDPFNLFTTTGRSIVDSVLTC